VQSNLSIICLGEGNEGWIQKLATKVVDNLQFEVNKIHIRFEDAVTAPDVSP
jgi:hypothetical protein